MIRGFSRLTKEKFCTKPNHKKSKVIEILLADELYRYNQKIVSVDFL